MAPQDGMFLDTLGALGAAAQLSGAGEKWRDTWARQRPHITGQEATATFGDDEIGLGIKRMYWAYAKPLHEAAGGITDNCQALADGCRQGVAQEETLDRDSARRMQG